MSTNDTAEAPQTGTEQRQCSPCHGTGKVISGLGGTPQQITCPWCDGTGVLQPGHDAQAHWRDD
jgi:DnaJ-class molecular chaperone